MIVSLMPSPGTESPCVPLTPVISSVTFSPCFMRTTFGVNFQSAAVILMVLAFASAGAFGTGTAICVGGLPRAIGRITPRDLPSQKPIISPISVIDIANQGSDFPTAEERLPGGCACCGDSCHCRGVIVKEEEELKNVERPAHHAHRAAERQRTPVGSSEFDDIHAGDERLCDIE